MDTDGWLNIKSRKLITEDVECRMWSQERWGVGYLIKQEKGWLLMFHDVDDLIFLAEEDKKYHSTKWYFLITVMRPVVDHRRFQALKNAEDGEW